MMILRIFVVFDQFFIHFVRVAAKVQQCLYDQKKKQPLSVRIRESFEVSDQTCELSFTLYTRLAFTAMIALIKLHFHELFCSGSADAHYQSLKIHQLDKGFVDRNFNKTDYNHQDSESYKLYDKTVQC